MLLRVHISTKYREFCIVLYCLSNFIDSGFRIFSLILSKIELASLQSTAMYNITVLFMPYLLNFKNPVRRLERHKSPNGKHWSFGKKKKNFPMIAVHWSRSNRNRTYDARFWRPLLYQLSYTSLIYLSHRPSAGSQRNSKCIKIEKGRFELLCTSHVQRHILTHYDVLSSASAFLLDRIHHRQ